MSFLSELVGAIRGAAETVGESFDSAGASIATAILGYPAESIIGGVTPTVQAGWRELIDNPNTPAPLRNLLQQYDRYPWPFRLAIAVVYVGTAVPALIAANHSAAVERMQQQVLSTERPRTLSVAEATMLLQRDLITEAQYRTYVALSGYTDGDIARLSSAARTLLDPTSLRDLFLRGILPEPLLIDGLRSLGYNTVDANLILRLFDFLPPVSDLIPFAVKDVYNPEARKRLDLDAEFPPEFAAEARKLGLAEEQARNYWAAHWQLPSPTQANEMLHRGVISEAQHADLIRALDYAPVWRERLAAISYRIPTRVDTRRMFELGVIDRHRVKKLYMDSGYTEQNAEALTAFIEKQAVEGDVAKKKRARDLTLGMVREAFRDGVIDADQEMRLLLDMNYDRDEAETLQSVDEYQRNRAWFRELESGVKSLFVKGYWGVEETAQFLSDFGYDVPHIERLIVVWNNLRLARELTDDEKAQRDLTKADVLTGYREHTLTRAKAVEYLQAMRYSVDEVEVLIANAEVAQKKADRRETLELIRLQYVNGQITRNAAIQAIDALGGPARERDALLARWAGELSRATTRLTVQQVTALYNAGLLPKEAVEGELLAMNYSSGHARLLTRLITE